MNKISKIFVAGHKGLLGSALLKKLKELGYDNIITKTHKELDLTVKDKVSGFFKKEKPEYVFLAAGKTGGILSNSKNPADYFYINSVIQNNVFEASVKYNIKNLVFYGSSCIYPKFSKQPIKEEYLLTGNIEETSIGYAAAKLSGLIACRVYNQQYDSKRFIALIPNTIYGPRDHFNDYDSHVLSALIYKIHKAKENNLKSLTLWGSGKPEREFIFSEDVAEASIFAVLNSDKLINSHYNIGTGTDISIKKLASVISGIAGFKGKILWDKERPDGTRKKLLDSSRFNKLGWHYKTGLEEGLYKTYQWYLKIKDPVNQRPERLK